MLEYSTKTYGRNDEVAELYKMFAAQRDISMHGPRRLGKTFLLDRLVDAAAANGWTAVKVELAGCADSRSAFRELCGRILNKRSGGQKAFAWLKQRLGQFLDPRSEAGGTWYQPFIGVDYETYFEHLIKAMHEDPERRWVLLIDELPIFLKALHDKGLTGLSAARDFMNQVSRLRQQYPKVRWMITGSIGIAPLAQTGNYMGVLAKFQNFELKPLTPQQAKDYLQDIALNGLLPHRTEITEAEAQALVEAVGWLAAFYLDALAQKLSGSPETAKDKATQAVDAAVKQLIKLGESAAFGTWEEHLRKHYRDADREIAFGALKALARSPQGTDIDGLLGTIALPNLMRDNLRLVLMRLDTEGFISVDSWELDSPRCNFLNPLLRLWWNLSQPQSTL